MKLAFLLTISAIISQIVTGIINENNYDNVEINKLLTKRKLLSDDESVHFDPNVHTSQSQLQKQVELKLHQVTQQLQSLTIELQEIQKSLQLQSDSDLDSLSSSAKISRKQKIRSIHNKGLFNVPKICCKHPLEQDEKIFTSIFNNNTNMNEELFEKFEKGTYSIYNDSQKNKNVQRRVVIAILNYDNDNENESICHNQLNILFVNQQEAIWAEIRGADVQFSPKAHYELIADNVSKGESYKNVALRKVKEIISSDIRGFVDDNHFHLIGVWNDIKQNLSIQYVTALYAIFVKQSNLFPKFIGSQESFDRYSSEYKFSKWEYNGKKILANDLDYDLESNTFTYTSLKLLKHALIQCSCPEAF